MLVTSGGGIARPGDPPPTPPPPRQSNLPLDTAMLSRDPAVIEAYVNDPLVYRGPVPQRVGMRPFMMPEQVRDIRLPVLIMAGDGVSDGMRSRVLHEFIGSKDKTLKLYENLLHEIFNEPEHLQVLADMEKWLEAHI